MTKTPAEQPRVLSTLNEDGSRRWLRPRLSEGRFLNRRRAVAYLLILVFTAIPYIKVNGKPMVLLDLATRHFTFFGTTFLPTDTLLLALLFVGVFVTIFLLTALFGRVWCGWACPQTVYMEFLFRPIERLFDGAPGRLKAGPLAGKIFSKPLKYFVFLLVSIYLAHTFLAYFVGVENLRHWVTSSPFRHPASFLIMAAVTVLMLVDFGIFRDQICIIICPYGRLQSALLDRNSLIVSYDRRRGEPRGRASRSVSGDVSLKVVDSPASARGDCVDCGMCVTTCPTGIDIREGLQMECINCTQCIDACDAVMTRLKRPHGLIRYGSQATIAGEKPRMIRPRIIIYPALLLVIVTAFFLVLASKGPADITVLRGVGRPFIDLPAEEIGNPIKVKITNRTDLPGDFSVTLSGVDGIHLTIDENPIHLAPGEAKSLAAMIAVPKVTFRREHPLVQVTVASVKPVNGMDFQKTINFSLLGPTHRDSDSSKDDDHGKDKHEEPFR